MSADDANSEVGRTVFARVNARDIAVADLYADDAYLSFLGQRHVGKDAIRAFYATVVNDPGHPRLRVAGIWNNGDLYSFLIESSGSNGVNYTIDTFEIVDEVIRSLRICLGGLVDGWPESS